MNTYLIEFTDGTKWFAKGQSKGDAYKRAVEETGNALAGAHVTKVASMNRDEITDANQEIKAGTWFIETN